MKKIFALPLSVALVASVIPPQVEAASLKDIKGHPYEASIQALVNEGVITGYPDQTYKPEQALTRWDVVVLLGRYLERKGYPVPSDYKTNMRFSDLTPTSGDMLLKYAAIVKDNGIFLGGNGQLLHKDLLSHHHAALVLVRAISKLAGTDFAMHDEEDFFLDIKNLPEQDRKAISIFAQLDLVSEQYFKPSTATTRGEFAHFLHGVRKLADPSELKVESVKVLSSSQLFVTFTDGRTHDVILSQRLEPNISETIRFTAYGKQFVEVVKMIVDGDFIVESVTNPNAAQFQIHFSKPVNLSDNYTTIDIQKIVQLTPRDGQLIPSLMYGELSADKKTLTVTTSGSYILNKRYYLRLNGVHSEDGTTLVYMREPVEFVEDKTKPELLYVEQLSLNETLVKFSEPVDSNYSRTYKLANGKQVSNVSASLTNDRTGIIFNLANARVDGKDLERNTDVIIDFTSVTDRKNNVKSNFNLKVRKSVQFKDNTPPELVSIEQYGAKKLKLTFTEPMRTRNLYNVQVISNNNNINYVDLAEQDPTNPNAYILTMENFLRGSATVTTRRGFYVFDLVGNHLTFNKRQSFNYNTAEPTVLNTEVVREDNNEYLYIYFDKNVELTMESTVGVTGTYTINSQKVNIQAPVYATLYPVEGNANVARVLLSELLSGIDREETNYSVSIEFNDVKNDYGINLNTPITAQFIRTKDYNYNANKLKVISVDTTRTNTSIKNSNLLIVNFNYAVDVESAMNINNYDFDKFVIEKVNVNRANPKQVELYIKSNSITSPTSEELSIENIRANGSVYPMAAYIEEVFINENVRPTLNMYVSSYPEYLSINETNALTGPREITLTYNEALAQMPSDLFVVKNEDGDILESEASLHPYDSRKVVITFEKDLPRYKAVTIQFKANRQLTDLYYNEVNRKPFKFTIPYY